MLCERKEIKARPTKKEKSCRFFHVIHLHTRLITIFHVQAWTICARCLREERLTLTADRQKRKGKSLWCGKLSLSASHEMEWRGEIRCRAMVGWRKCNHGTWVGVHRIHCRNWWVWNGKCGCETIVGGARFNEWKQEKFSHLELWFEWLMNRRGCRIDIVKVCQTSFRLGIKSSRSITWNWLLNTESVSEIRNILKKLLS